MIGTYRAPREPIMISHFLDFMNPEQIHSEDMMLGLVPSAAIYP